MFGRSQTTDRVYGMTDEEAARDKKERENYLRAKRSGYSSYYHKYFEGYMEQRMIGKNGKVRIERIYVGDTYTQDVSDKRWVLQKILFFALYFCGAAAAVLPNSVTWTGRADWYLEVCLAIGMLMMFLLLYVLIAYAMAKRKLTVWGYKETSQRLKTCAKLTAYVFAAAFLAQIVYVFINHLHGIYLLPLVFSPVAAALFYLIHYIESRLTTYTRIPYKGDLDCSDDSVVI